MLCRFALLVIVTVGCTRPYKRSAPLATSTPPQPVAQMPVPTPPSPPPLVPTPPPLPAVADSPGLPDPAVATAGYTEEADDTRRKERQKRREERREERRERTNPTPPAPTPPAPTTPAPTPSASIPQPSRPKTSDRATVAALVEASAARWATVPDFEARLIKREVANGNVVPQSEMLYRYRQNPHSVYMKVVGGAGMGREVLYVRGKYGDKMHLITGKGDNRLVGAGFRTELDPHDKQATAKSRYSVTEAGFGRILGGLQKQLAATDSKVVLKSLGTVQRPEHAYPLDGIEATIPPGVDPTLPKGGVRQIYFDPKPDSASFRLPVLVTCQDADGREVEYYSFDRFKVPSGWQDADWHPGRLK